MKNYCHSCPEHQLAALVQVPEAPLIPLSVMELPFMHVAMDLVGPLPKGATRFRYVLVIINYATWFPEVVPLRSIMAQMIAGLLLKIFTRVGLHREIFTNQGSNFTSWMLQQVCELLGIK